MNCRSFIEKDGLYKIYMLQGTCTKKFLYVRYFWILLIFYKVHLVKMMQINITREVRSKNFENWYRTEQNENNGILLIWPANTMTY